MFPGSVRIVPGRNRCRKLFHIVKHFCVEGHAPPAAFAPWRLDLVKQIVCVPFGSCRSRAVYCNTVCMNIFLKKLSERFSDDIILLCCDGAAWHKSSGLELPENIILFRIPPYTPEMNPIEQIWKEIRKRGFRNEVFATLEKVVDRLCDTICSLSNNAISSITGRDWIIKAFN